MFISLKVLLSALIMVALPVCAITSYSYGYNKGNDIGRRYQTTLDINKLKTLCDTDYTFSFKGDRSVYYCFRVDKKKRSQNKKTFLGETHAF